MSDELSTKRWTAGSKSAPSACCCRRIHSPFWKARDDVAVGGASRDLVHDVEAHPDSELESQVRPAAWQAPGCLGDEARHDVSDSNEVVRGRIPRRRTISKPSPGRISRADRSRATLDLSRSPAPSPSWADGCAIRRAGLARSRDGVSRLGLDVHRARDRRPRPAAVSRDVDAPPRRGRGAARVRASARRSRARIRSAAAQIGAAFVFGGLLFVAGPRLARVGAADGAGGRRRAPRRDDPDLDGALRPRRVRAAPAGGRRTSASRSASPGSRSSSIRSARARSTGSARS